MIVGQVIELRANNKFITYCRKAFGGRRFAYNWCVEKFKKDQAAHCAAMSKNNKELSDIIWRLK